MHAPSGTVDDVDACLMIHPTVNSVDPGRPDLLSDLDLGSL